MKAIKVVAKNMHLLLLPRSRLRKLQWHGKDRTFLLRCTHRDPKLDPFTITWNGELTSESFEKVVDTEYDERDSVKQN